MVLLVSERYQKVLFCSSWVRRWCCAFFCCDGHGGQLRANESLGTIRQGVRSLSDPAATALLAFGILVTWPTVAYISTRPLASRVLVTACHDPAELERARDKLSL